MRRIWLATASSRSPSETAVKFKLDENLPDLVRKSLGSLGHDAHTVTDEGLSGARDETVLEACIAEDRILITLDLDFSDIRTYRPGSHPGIWVLRPTRQTFGAIEALVRAGVQLAAIERVQGQLWVIDERRVRIRDGNA
jgi:predicted nuclease of predicted toxin-antitoxin system